MEDKTFVWNSEITKRFFKLRFENDELFKSRKRPWAEFHKLLLENGFPSEMTIEHVRKKWSYTYDSYKIAKKTNKTNWKYYKIFDKHYGKSQSLDKYESWNDDWRLKLIICISEAKEMKLDVVTVWRTVERALRCQDLPPDCCIRDMKGLWHHIKMTFTRKHRVALKRGCDVSEWALYDTMLSYFKKFEPEQLASLECPSDYVPTKNDKSRAHVKADRNSVDDNDGSNENEHEFNWTKDITETFIQIRLQHNWLFKQKKNSWNDLHKIMLEEYGFPKSLKPRELGRKWVAIYAEYQKSKATNNTSWLYHTLFELYLGDASLSINPLSDWQEEWIFNLISARTDLELLFHTFQDKNWAWREVEKRLRAIGLPLDHSLLELPEMWNYLLRMLKWKQKFANKGILAEQWPYYEAMTRYSEKQQKHAIKKCKIKSNDVAYNDGGYDDVAGNDDDDFEDDMKLVDLKEKMNLCVKPKDEYEETLQCRSCSKLQALVDIFEEIDDEGLDVASKLKVIGGIEVQKTDNLPNKICQDCQQELENAYKFRRKCQNVDKQLRGISKYIKVEVDNVENSDRLFDDANDDPDITDDLADISYEPTEQEIDELKQERTKKPPPIKKIKFKPKRVKKQRKIKYDYWKVCEVCGKHTKNLNSHLDAHATDKLYSCAVCDKKFKFKSGLILHRAVHDPTPKKTCEVCGKSFHILAQYRRHFVYHANERKHECETCGKRFNTVDILRVHNRMHTDERPFSCAECGKTFRTAGCVSRHRRIVHRNIKNIKKNNNQ